MNLSFFLSFFHLLQIKWSLLNVELAFLFSIGQLEIVKKSESTLSFKPDLNIVIVILALWIEFYFIVILPNVNWLILILKLRTISLELTHDSLIIPSNCFPYVLRVFSDQINWCRRIAYNLLVNMRHLNSIFFFVECNYSLLNVMPIDYHFPGFNIAWLFRVRRPR